MSCDETSLADGTVVRLRVSKHDGPEPLTAFFASLSPESLHKRFLAARTRVEADELREWTAESADRFALEAAAIENSERIIGFAQAARISGDAAEVAITVADAYQHRGLGRLLLRRLAAEARRRQIRWFVFDAYPDNVAVWRLASKAGTGTRRMNSDGMATTLVSLDGIEDEDGAIPCLAATG
jgi:RimJ/RimL family protein N-acetyltransferase